MNNFLMLTKIYWLEALKNIFSPSRFFQLIRSSLYRTTKVYLAFIKESNFRSSLIYNMSARHERDECDTSETSATRAIRMQYECNTSDTSVAQVRYERHECDTSATRVLQQRHEFDTSEKF